jgi:predicted Zn-dependent peptidase
MGAVLPDGALPAADRRVSAIGAGGVKRIVAHRDIGAPLTILAFAAPAPSSSDFGSMLMMQTLFSTVFDTSPGSTPQAIARSVQAFYQFDAAPASFVVIVNGARTDRSTGIGEVLVTTKALAKSKLDDKALAQLKVQTRGALLNATLGLGDRAYLLGTLNSQGVGPDALNAALDAIDRVTAADLMRVANAYLQKFLVAEVMPRDARGG